jgi:hypothetical protein
MRGHESRVLFSESFYSLEKISQRSGEAERMLHLQPERWDLSARNPAEIIPLGLDWCVGGFAAIVFVLEWWKPQYSSCNSSFIHLVNIFSVYWLIADGHGARATEIRISSIGLTKEQIADIPSEGIFVRE